MLPMQQQQDKSLTCKNTKIRWDRCGKPRPFPGSAGVPGQKGLTQPVPWAKSLWVAADRAAQVAFGLLWDSRWPIPAVSDK